MDSLPLMKQISEMAVCRRTPWQPPDRSKVSEPPYDQSLSRSFASALRLQV